MRRRPLILSGSVAVALVLAPVPAWSTAPGAGPGTAGSYVLTATDTGSDYAPTFTGNGYLGVRVPAAGQGYAAGSVPAQSELAGFYAQPAGQVQQRANIPTWSTLTFSDGGQDFNLTTGTVTGWRQRIDLHTGEITTTARWTAPNGHVTDLRYDVFTDRARKQVGVVRLDLTPRWSGPATVTDLIDGTPATMTTGVAQGRDGWRDWETVRTVGTGLDATLASQLGFGGDVRPSGQTTVGGGRTVGQRVTFPVRSGRTYTLTKYVGVAGPGDADARGQAAGAAARGFDALRGENRTAWAALWADRVDVLGDPTLATEVNASEFYLWSSTRAGVDWSVSPAGLSSNGYAGHVFWDAETWMFPTLLALHPELAAGMNDYRYDRLAAAEKHAAQTGYPGARYPWESALDGTEQIPPPVSVNSEGLYEQHITADVALAQWQYYLATGDRSWLAARGWPVLSRAAAFWAGRVTRDAAGAYHIADVTGPDEENPDVDDEAYTNVAAAATLRIATDAAHVVGVTPPANWSAIAAHLSPPYDAPRDLHPEFTGYQGQMVKQADVTMLQYPWAYPMGGEHRDERPELLRAPVRPRWAVDERRHQLDRHGRARHAGLCHVHLHPAQHRAVHAGRVRPVLRDPDRRCVHVHDRHRGFPAGVPLRLLRAAVERRLGGAVTDADRPAARCGAARTGLARHPVHGGRRHRHDPGHRRLGPRAAGPPHRRDPHGRHRRHDRRPDPPSGPHPHR